MEYNNFMEHLDVPFLSRTNKKKHSSSNHSSSTHLSVCHRSRDYFVETRKHNVLSHIPIRLDPNVEFSDDGEPPVSVKKPTCNCKENNNHNKEYSLPSDVIEVNGKIYKVLTLLGEGGSSKVYTVFNVADKSLVALKRVNLKNTGPLIREGYKQEIEFLQRLQNSNRVIKMFDFECHKNELILILEHGDTDFAKYISKEAKVKRVSHLQIKYFWIQMLEAVADIHKYGIVHSDLKPENFLLFGGNLKLIDFGIATSVSKDKTSTFRYTRAGTVDYMSPEAIIQTSADSRHPCFIVGVKSDVWSLGCILYLLIYGVTPFQDIKGMLQKLNAIINPSYEIPFKPLSDPLLLDVLKSCLKKNMIERASIEELLKHPYLAEHNSYSTNALHSKPDLDSYLCKKKI